MNQDLSYKRKFSIKEKGKAEESPQNISFLVENTNFIWYPQCLTMNYPDFFFEIFELGFWIRKLDITKLFSLNSFHSLRLAVT